jgi:hypothetical protein
MTPGPSDFNSNRIHRFGATVGTVPAERKHSKTKCESANHLKRRSTQIEQQRGLSDDSTIMVSHLDHSYVRNLANIPTWIEFGDSRTVHKREEPKVAQTRLPDVGAPS